MRGPIPRARGPVVLLVHHGPVDRARPELTGALTVRPYGAAKLTAAARSSSRPKSGGAVARLHRRRRGSEIGGSARCGASGGMEKRNKERHELWCGAVMR
jgi:hypothetical protein